MKSSKFSLVVVAAVTFASVAMLAGCETNPVTGRQIFTPLAPTRSQEIQMGQQYAPKLAAEMGGKTKDAELQRYVEEIGARLAAVTETDNPSLPWEFTLLDSDVINAFALPGGKVFMSRGLAERMTNEAQLAGVLGHEVGHVTARHTAEQMANAGLASLAVGVGSAVLTDGTTASAQQISQMGQQIGGVILLKYGRDQESEADYLGMRYMSRIGYNPAAQGQVMQILLEASKGGRQPEIFATHPYPETRIERIKGWLAGEYASTQNNPAFQLREQEFRTRFLSRIAPKRAAAGDKPHDEHATDIGAVMTRDSEGRRFPLGNPVLWCGLCREQASRAR